MGSPGLQCKRHLGCSLGLLPKLLARAGRKAGGSSHSPRKTVSLPGRVALEAEDQLPHAGRMPALHTLTPYSTRSHSLSVHDVMKQAFSSDGGRNRFREVQPRSQCHAVLEPASWRCFSSNTASCKPDGLCSIPWDSQGETEEPTPTSCLSPINKYIKLE